MKTGCRSRGGYDSLPKAKGMAEYADAHPKSFRRIELVDEIDGSIRVLDLTDQRVRTAILKATNLKVVYQSKVASDY
jgi:hypothetical protein